MTVLDPPRPTSPRTRTVAAMLSVVLLGLGMWVTVRGVAHVHLLDVVGVVAAVSRVHVLVLASVWALGLVVYATVLAAALPGLGLRRSLLLNLTGSAVANVIPLGGAVATGLNWRMVRSWGHTNGSFATFCVLTNALDVVGKLSLPPLAVAVLLVGSGHVPAPMWLAAGIGAIGLGVLWWLQHWIVVQDRDRGGDAGPTRPWLTWVDRASVHVVASVVESRQRFARHPLPLVLGTVGYAAAQLFLLWLCLSFLGLGPALPVVVTAYALERIGSLVALTPAGAGIAELGTVAWLISAGLPPAGAVASVLLFRLLVVGLEVPVGGALLGLWLWSGRRIEVAR